jgi:hypothetical protein
MHRQSSETCQEEEDQERDQDLAEFGWRAECDRSVGCCQGSTGKRHKSAQTNDMLW